MPFSLVTDEVLKEKDNFLFYLESTKSYSFPPSDEFKSSNLLKERKGLMFALLIAETKEGERVLLRGFSGLAESHHQVPGYVNPTYSINAFKELERESDILSLCYEKNLDVKKIIRRGEWTAMLVGV